MREVSVKSIYNVDTISKNNQKPWVKLMEYMRTEVAEGEDIMFDFKGIDVIQPWSTNEFKMFMQDTRVHLRLWCSANTVNSINIMCTLNNMSDNRAFNQEIQVAKKLTKEEQAVIRMADQLQEYFKEYDGVPVLEVFRRFDQIGVYVTVNYIQAGIQKYIDKCKEQGISHDKIKVEAKGIAIQSSVIEAITQMVGLFSKEGVEIDFHSDDEEVMNKIGMYQSLSKNNIVSESDKIKTIKLSLHPGKVGMLVKYRDSKAVDEFGRSGKGKPISCRVAIYMGMKRDGNIIGVCFNTYNGNTFYTHTHWSIEHDHEYLDKLDVEELFIPISQFGMYNEFLGSRYHLLTPVQTREEDSMVMFGLDDMGKVTRTKMTIPERIKAVLDDFGVDYEVETLQAYIQRTKEVLKK